MGTKKITERQKTEMKKLRALGLSLRRIGKIYEVDEKAVRYILSRKLSTQKP